MIKLAIISAYPIPYPGIGSWVKRIEYFLNNNNCQIDYLICPSNNSKTFSISNPSIEIKNASRKNNKFLAKIFKNYPYSSFSNVIVELLRKNEGLVIMIMDNYKILRSIQDTLINKNLRERVRIVYNMCGHSYFFSPSEGERFYDSIDEMIYLTNTAYQFETQRYHSIRSEVSILPNPVDTKKFYKVSDKEKELLRNSVNIPFSTTVFIWLSRDKPKKGLDIILRAWETIYCNHPNLLLLIIGGKDGRKYPNGVISLGILPHDQLPKYLMLSDYYLFSTLCYEGYPLSLLEAISCGVIPIASSIGSVNEILENGKIGILVENPHQTVSWVNTISKVITNKNLAQKNINISEKLISLEEWTIRFSNYFMKWKNILDVEFRK